MAATPASTSAEGAGAIESRVGGNRLRLLERGVERLDVLLGLIAGAQESVRLLFYIFDSDSAGEAVRDAAVEAAARGVSVEILVDGFGCGNVDPAFFQPLTEAGGEYRIFHGKYGRRYLLRNHQKLVVIDEKVAIVGGANIEEDYLTDSGDSRWRDLWLVVEGPAVPPAARYFDAISRWMAGKHQTLRGLRAMVNSFSDRDGLLQWQFSGPMSLRNPWPRRFARDIGEAMRLDVIAAYFAPPTSMLRRIGRLARRGRVRIITASRTDNNATIAAARHTYSRLLRRRVAMFEYRPARLHTKLLIVDDSVYIGSANLDFRSVYINLEIMLRIHDPGFAAAMRGYFERELRDSEEITDTLHRHRANPWRRFKWALSYFLVTTMDYTVTRRLNFPEK